MVRVVHFESGLGNQMLDYCDYIAIKKMNPNDKCYAEDMVYDIPECGSVICQWNGLEIENIFGIQLNNLKTIFSDEQWDQIIDIVKSNQLIPFLDMAYQGFSKGINEDGRIVRRFAETYAPVFVSNSFSKSFSLYGERVGAFSLVASNADESARILSQLKRVIRTNYSNPPIYGAKIVSTVLSNPSLHKMWEDELASMRDRIHLMRHQLADKLTAKKPDLDFSFITRQAGMFSYSGLTPEQVRRLKNEFSIYIVETGRICIAALNSHNIDYVVDAIAHIL